MDTFAARNLVGKNKYYTMKKFIMILAAMVCLTSCMTSNEEAIYSLKLNWVSGGNSSLSIDGSSSEAVKEAYDEINGKIKAFKNQYTREDWTETIHNGKYSKADKNAKALFNTAASALDDLQKECDAIVNNIPSGLSAGFEIEYNLVVSRFSDAKDNILDQKNFKVAYDWDNGNNAAI